MGLYHCARENTTVFTVTWCGADPQQAAGRVPVGAAAGIVTAVIVVTLLIVLVALLVVRRRRLIAAKHSRYSQFNILLTIAGCKTITFPPRFDHFRPPYCRDEQWVRLPVWASY